MEQQTEKPKRRPSIEVRCPKCGMREIWHHLPKGGDRCRWCGHLFEDFTYRKVGPSAKEGGAMTNWEHLFGTPERAIHTETEFHSWPFFIAVYETSRMSNCTTSKRLLASFCEEADYLEWLKAEYDDGTVEWEER